MKHASTYSEQSKREPPWRAQQRCPRASIPAEVRGWLLNTASLTRRVRQTCGDRFRVRVLARRWQRPEPGEARALGLPRGRFVLVREVQLMCAERPWVYARTVIPPRTLRGGWRQLAHLGSKPLGAVLFTDRTLRRERVEIARLAAGQRLFDAATRQLETTPAAVWGRRSLFSAGGKRLLVSEVFLPGIAPCRN